MAIRLQTNPIGLIARQNFSGNLFFLSDSVRQLSSGLRVNKTADDPIAVSLASQLDSQALGLGQAAKNANDGVSAMQVVDNSLAAAMDILGLVHNKAVTAAQDDQDATSRAALHSDISKLLTELDQLIDAATFHDVPLLSGTYTNKAFQIGTVAGQTLAASLPAARPDQIGAVQSGEMTISSSVGGLVNLQLVNQAANQTIRVSAVTLAYDNDPDHGMAALATAINTHADTTGIAAQAVVAAQSGAAISAGITPAAFAINGVPIGAVAVLDRDSDGRLLLAINGKTASHGVTAALTADGVLRLSASDGRAIAVTGAGGTLGFSDAEMTTFGLTRILQNGHYALNLTDQAVGLAVAFTPTLRLAGSVTTTIDSILAKNSVLGGSSALAAGWTAGLDISGAELNGNIVTSQTSMLMADSVLASGSLLAASSILGGTITLAGAVSTTTESLLRAGSTLTAGSILSQGSYLTNAIDTTTGPLTAGQFLSGDVTLSGGLTLSRDMILLADSVLGAGSALAAASHLGGDIALGGDLTMTEEMTLALGSTIQDSVETRLAAGSTIGGRTQLTGATLTLTEAMLVTAGSTLTASSQLALGSTLGGTVILAGDHTASYALYLAAGSSLAARSLIKSGSTLTNALVTTSGPLAAGTLTSRDITTSGVNTLTVAMTLKQGSVLAGGSTLAANSRSESPVDLSQESTLRLNEISVLTKDDATIAVKVIAAARTDLDRIRQQAAAISEQLAGLATVQGGGRDMMEGAKSRLLAVDFGEEAVNFTRMEMLIRTSSFALTQANAVPANVFTILQGDESRANQFFITALNRVITAGGVVS